MFRSRCRPASRSSTSRCVVTSSAVVASSATSTSGLVTRAAAIATRCRIPPDSWNGYCRATRAGRPTSARLASTAACRAAFGSPRSAMAIWSPQRWRGLRLVNGSCGSSVIVAPRTPRQARCPPSSGSVSPPIFMVPPAVRPVGSRPVSARAVTDLPLPDSPTIATVSP